MSTFFRILILVPGNFYFTLYLAIAFCSGKLSRKVHFLARILYCSIFTIAISFGISYLLFINRTLSTPTMIITYFLLFVFLFLTAAISINVCFNIKFKPLLLYCFTGYAIKNFYEYVFHLILLWILGLNVHTSMKIYMEGYCIMLFTYTILYFLLIRKFQKTSMNENPRTSIILLSAFTLFVSILLNLIRTFDNSGSLSLHTIILIFSLCNSLLVILLYTGLLEKSSIEQEMMMMQLVWKEKEKQLQITKENNELINITYHDLKRQINSINNKDLITDELFSKLNNALNSYCSIIKTGNDTLDIIMSKHLLFCKQNNICFSFMIDGEKLGFMSATEITALFENAIENSIEAVMHLSVNNRMISLIVSQKFNFLSVCIENPYVGEIQIKESLPVTSKENNFVHGYGTKSIKLIVQKHHGTMLIETVDGIFSLKILFPITQN